MLQVLFAAGASGWWLRSDLKICNKLVSFTNKIQQTSEDLNKTKSEFLVLSVSLYEILIRVY